MSYFRYFGHMANSHLVSDEMVEELLGKFQQLFSMELQEVENRGGEQFFYMKDETIMRRLYLRAMVTHHSPVLDGGEKITTIELTDEQLELLNRVRKWPIGAYGKEGE